MILSLYKKNDRYGKENDFSLIWYTKITFFSSLNFLYLMYYFLFFGYFLLCFLFFLIKIDLNVGEKLC